MTSSAAHSAGRLLAEVTCPNCWHRFPPEQVLFVARHDALVGDAVLGATAYRRFRPSRFTAAGDAIDPEGMACDQVACPRCHLEIPRPLLEMPPVFCSIIGGPASGKSYYLAAMTWQLRAIAARCGLTLADGDPSANHELHQYEQTLFLNPDPDRPVELRKTEPAGGTLYRTTTVDGQTQTFPSPFVFTVGRSRRGREPGGHRTLVLYENAGEHYLPGQETPSLPVTLHMAMAEALFFLFDPTQDPRFRRHCRSDDPQVSRGVRPGGSVPPVRQEVLFHEMAARVRRYRGLDQTATHERPLHVLLAKADIWDEMIEEDTRTEPLRSGRRARLDMERIERVSAACRDRLDRICPEFVAAVESFSSEARFLPVSALGGSPEPVRRDGDWFYGIPPRRIAPRWCAVPFLLALSHHFPRLAAREDHGRHGGDDG